MKLYDEFTVICHTEGGVAAACDKCRETSDPDREASLQDLVSWALRHECPSPQPSEA